LRINYIQTKTLRSQHNSRHTWNTGTRAVFSRTQLKV